MEGCVVTVVQISALFFWLLSFNKLTANQIYNIKENTTPGVVVGNLNQYLESNGCSDSVYSLMKSPYSDYFNLNAQNDLIITRKIDREQVCSRSNSRSKFNGRFDTEECKINLEIYCDRLFDKFPVNIIIDDVNDNAPRWKSRSLNIKIIDNTKESRILPLAIDDDSDNNARIKYNLVTGSGPAHFILRQDKNQLSLESTHVIDREAKEKYILYLVATDEGIPPKSSTLTLNVLVEDRNDNDPIFTKREYSLSSPLSETTPVNTEILRLQATDKDKGIFGKFTFDFSKSEEHSIAKEYFRVSHDGKIFVNKPLDYDNGEHEFRFKVTVRDSPGNSDYRSTEATVLISLRDENDEKPIISVSYPKNSQTIKENDNSDRPCAFIRVEDRDYNGQDRVNCRLHNDNFKLIDRKSSNGGQEYKLRAVTSFDRELHATQNVDIICSDSVGNTAVKNITFTIEDENDHAPIFQNSIHLQIKENQRPNSLVDGRIIALDNDTGLNSKVRYNLAPGFDVNFSIDPASGRLTSKVKFDREVLAMHLLKVLAIDQGSPNKTSTATFTVSITDENDHPPYFNSSHYEFHVKENRHHHNMVVAKVHAEDKDEASNAEVNYDLVKDTEAHLFRISPKTGDIILIKALDRELKSKYLLKVRAFNPRPTVLRETSTATVTIIVDDVNDNRPEFVYPNITHKSVEVSSIVQGGLIAVIRAKDADSQANSKIVYTMNSNTLPIPFSLDKGSGTLYIDGKIQPSLRPTYLVNFRACDQGVPQQCETYRNFRINIRKNSLNSPPYSGDLNDNSVGNEPIIVCLSVIFIILVVATIILVFLIRRKIYWLNNQRSRKDTVPEISGPQVVKPGISLNPDGEQSYKEQEGKLEEEAFLQMNPNKYYTVDDRTKRKRNNFNDFARADYQTLDGLCMSSANPVSTSTLRYACEPPTYYEIATNQIANSQPSYEQFGTLQRDNFLLHSATIPHKLSSPNVLQKLDAEEVSTADIPLNCPTSLKHSSFKSDKNLCPSGSLTPHSKPKYGYAAYSEASFV